MLGGRKEQIFFSIVENYIESGEPVGSKSIMNLLGDSVSSATIRNDMAYLTALGLIGQPHTSAGRVPTMQGIRYYLDNMLPKKTLSAPEKLLVDKIIDECDKAADNFFYKACESFSDKLSLTVIGKAPVGNDTVAKIELFETESGVYILSVITADLSVKSKLCIPKHQISNEEIAYFKKNIGIFLEGRSLQEISLSFIQSIGAKMGLLGLTLSPFLSAIYEISLLYKEDGFFLEGESHLIEKGDASPDSLKGIKKLIKSGEIGDLFKGNGTEILLSSEIYGVDSPLCIIMSAFKYDGKKGYFGVISPIRTLYSKLLPCIEYFASRLSKGEQND